MTTQTSFLWRREPVDWKALNILDYPKKVKNPMDLGTIRKKLHNSEYHTIEEGVSGSVILPYGSSPPAFTLPV